MRSFRKAVVVSTVFLLCVVVASVLLIEPYYLRQQYSHMDANVRNEMAGSIDFIFLGSSHGLHAAVPEVIDQGLQTTSYNLSSSFATMQGKYTMLKKEVDRNPVKTVVLELSYSSLTRNRDTEGPEGDIYLLARLDSPWERIRYFFSAMRLRDYTETYYHLLNYGIANCARVFQKVDMEPRFRLKGFSPAESNDMSKPLSEMKKVYNTQKFDETLFEENVSYLDQMIELCKEHNIEIIIVTTPMADRLLCEYGDNLDVFYHQYAAIAEEYGIAFYDFNLLKEKSALFPDENAYNDSTHMSEAGAYQFSEIFTVLLRKVQNGEDISELFYSDYQEMDYSKGYATYSE